MRLNKFKSAVMILLLAFAVGAKAEEVREVSGTVYTSLIPDNVALKLSGDTKLVVNMDRVITKIEGRTPNLLNPKFNLEIEGVDDHQLTVNQQYGATGILVNSLFCSARIIIFSTGRCVYTNEDITFTNELLAKSTNKENLSAITSIHGNIMMSGANFQVNAPSVALFAAKDIKLKGQGNFFSGNKKPAIYSVSGNVTIQSGFFQMDGGILASEGAFNMIKGTLITDGGSNNPGIQAKGDITLDGEITATGTYGVLSTEGNITNQGVLCATGKNVSAIRAEKGDITLEGKVQATGKYNCAAAGSNAANKTLTVKGNFIGETTSYDNDDNDTMSCLFGYYVFIEEGAVVELDANHWGIFSQKAVHLNGNVKVYAENKNGKAVFSHGDIYVKGGNILLKARRHGGNNPFDTVSYVGTEEAMTWGGVLDIVSPMAVTYPENWKIWDYDYGGEHTITNMDDKYFYISGARHIEFGAPQLSGDVSIQSPAVIPPGTTLGYKLEGMVDSLYKAGDEIIGEWQKSSNLQEWTTLQGTYDGGYTTTTNDLGQFIRVKVTAKKYDGFLISLVRQVKKSDCTTSVVAPSLSISGNQVVVDNAKMSQEYIILSEKKEVDKLSSSDWAGARTITTAATTLQMGGTAYSMNYVYTRVKETESTNAGTEVKMAAIYLGSSTAVQMIDIVPQKVYKTYGSNGRTYWRVVPLECEDEDYYYCNVNDTIELSVKTYPEDAAFQGIKGQRWYQESYKFDEDHGKFYADRACTQELEDNKKYKVVYYKPTSPQCVYYIQGFHDGQMACEDLIHLIVGENGDYPINITSNEFIDINKGETLEGLELKYTPSKASFANLEIKPTVEGNEKAPVVTLDKENRTYSVNAENAEAGHYRFDIYIQGEKAEFIRVTVIAPTIEEIAIMPQNISGEKGDTIQLSVAFTPSNTTAPVTWSSSNPEIAIVNEEGQLVFTGGKPGDKATITATCGEFAETKEVTVRGKTYDLWIAGVQVNSQNMNSLTEIVSEQSEEMMEYFFGNECNVSFDGFDLTLENMLISPEGDVAGIWSEIDGLNINLVGENTVKSQSYGINLKRNTTISGKGTLNIDSNVYGILCTAADDNINLTIRDASVYSKGYAWGINGDIASSLTFENANVTAEGSRYGGIGNINNGILFAGCNIIEPANALIEEGFVKADGDFAKKVVIAADSQPTLKGDVNEDGHVDISDIVAVINQIAGTSTYRYADVNEDNKVDISDIVAIINIIAGQ